jgi:hypothetical protein
MTGAGGEVKAGWSTTASLPLLRAWPSAPARRSDGLRQAFRRRGLRSTGRPPAPVEQTDAFAVHVVERSS